MDEVERIQQVREGDQQAFEALFDSYKQRALQTAYFIVGNRYTSEDVVQDTFVECYFKIDKLKDASKFKFWFYKILIRTAWKYSEKQKKDVPTEHILETVDDVQQESSTESKVVRNAENERLFQAIGNLDLKRKTVIVLFYFNQMTIPEIAKTLGIFEGTVKSRLHSAKKCLYRELENERIFEERGCVRNG